MKSFPDTTADITATVAIPTYNREELLINTVEALLLQEPLPRDILVVDQTEEHDQQTEKYLREKEAQKKLRRIKQSPPSLTMARNRALLESSADVVIFIDDDVELAPGFVEAHRRCYLNPEVMIVAGQVLSPDRLTVDVEPAADALSFPLNYTRQAWIKSPRGCNHSVRRKFALSIGGYDQNYTGSAYREETDFALRAARASGRAVFFEPAASLVHLAEDSGGIRTFGDIYNPMAFSYPMNDYYFAFRNFGFLEMVLYLRKRRGGVINRYSIKRPWLWLPLLFREILGFIVALRKAMRGPVLLDGLE